MNYEKKLTHYINARTLESELKKGSELNQEVFSRYMSELEQAGMDSKMYTEFEKYQDKLTFPHSHLLSNKLKNKFYGYKNERANWKLYVSIFLLFYFNYDKVLSLFERKPEPSGGDDKAKATRTDNTNVASIYKGMSAEAVKPEQALKERFADIVGIDEFKTELEDIVDYLKDPLKYTNMGATFPKGILLSGPPGTGKTLIARAVAGEATCSFFYKSGSEFQEMWRGTGKDNVKAIFDNAKAHSPAIIFIDEIDAVGGKRGNSGNVAINQLLAEMDGFAKSDNVIVIGATNLEDSLDPALVRSGRFDKVIRVPLPDQAGREKIFQYYLSKIKHDFTANSKMVAKKSIGFSGADIKNLVNTAIIHAVKKNRTLATDADFDFAYDRIRMGVRRNNDMYSKEQKREAALRQVSQGMISYSTDGAMKFYKITILPNGSSLGHISLVPSKDGVSMSRKNILAQIDLFMAGRAAEELFLGPDRASSACARDLSQASNLAYQYVRDLGMEDKSLFVNNESRELSQVYKFKADVLVQGVLEKSLKRTKAALLKKKGDINRLVDHLVEKETLSFQEFEAVLNN